MTTEKYTSNTYKIGEIIEITELLMQKILHIHNIL